MSCRFLYYNYSDLVGTLSASSAATDYPVTNLKVRWKTYHWRSTAVTEQYIHTDLGAPYAITDIGIYYHNARAGANQIHFQADADNAGWDEPDVSVPITVTADMASRGIAFYHWDSAQTYRYWRVSFTADAGHPDGYFRVGKFYVGLSFTPIRMFSANWSQRYIDPSTLNVSVGGQVAANVRNKYSQFSLPFSIVSPDDVSFKYLADWLGKNKSFFITLDTSGATTTVQTSTYYVRCASDWELRHIYNKTLYEMSLDLIEEL